MIEREAAHRAFSARLRPLAGRDLSPGIRESIREAARYHFGHVPEDWAALNSADFAIALEGDRVVCRAG